MSAQDFDIEGCTIAISDVERSIWKGVTKADLITYYHTVSGLILPYLKDRPQSLHIKPTNANAPGFYIKDMEGREPDCASIFKDKRRHEAKGKGNQIDYLICNNEATLLWMVNLGCIDINPWNSRTDSPACPDFIAIDLDPSDAVKNKSNRSYLLETAIATKEYCDKKKLKAFAKTSGKTGIHFFIPCSGFTNGQVRGFAEQICASIHVLVPGSSTTENSVASRDGKVYLDPSQNDYADTLAAVYSVRPAHEPTVSAPLDWREINKSLDPSSFTMHNIQARIMKKGDLFAGLLDRQWALSNNKLLLKF